jgi:hypothetical protein
MRTTIHGKTFVASFNNNIKNYNNKKATVVWLSLSTCVVSHYFFGYANIGLYRPIVMLETSDGRDTLQQSFSIWSRSVVPARRVPLDSVASTEIDYCRNSDHPYPMQVALCDRVSIREAKHLGMFDTLESLLSPSE